MTVMVSTFATSSIFTIIIMFMIYLSGHLQAIANEVWKQTPTILGKLGLKFLNFFIPDVAALTVVDDVVVGKGVTMAYLWSTTGYALFYMLVVLVLAALIFEEKEL